MTEPPAVSMKAQVAEFLAELGTRLLPSARFILRVVGAPAAWLWAVVSSHRLRRLLLLGGFAGTVLVVVKGVPVIYGRMALASAAATAAQQSLLQGVDRVQHNLNREAFMLGFTEASTRPELFQVEPFSEEGLPQCSVTYDFIHVVNFYGMVQVPVSIRGKVVRMAVEPATSTLVQVD